MRNSMIQRLIIAAIAFAASGGALADESRTCTLHKLSGLYVFSTTGYSIVSGAAQPIAIVEMIRFNGDGTLTVPAVTVSINGLVLSPEGATGTYTVESNCTGKLQFVPGPINFDIFPAPSGDELWMIRTDANTVFAGNVTRISR